MYTALKNPELMNALNALDSLKEQREKLSAFYDVANCLDADTDIKKDEGSYYDFHDLYWRLDANLQNLILAMEKKIAVLLKKKTRKAKPVPVDENALMPY